MPKRLIRRQDFQFSRDYFVSGDFDWKLHQLTNKTTVLYIYEMSQLQLCPFAATYINFIPEIEFQHLQWLSPLTFAISWNKSKCTFVFRRFRAPIVAVQFLRKIKIQRIINLHTVWKTETQHTSHEPRVMMIKRSVED